MFKRFVYSIALAVWLIASGGVQAETVTIGSDADTYIRDGVVRGDLEFMDLRGGGSDFAGYLRFDLARINVLTVQSATLTLTVSGGASRNDTVVGGRFSLYGLNNVAGNTPQDWDETVLTEGNIGVEWSTNNGDPLVNVTDLDEDVPGITETVTNAAGGGWAAGTTIVVTGEPLVRFIQSRVDDNGLVTFILRDDDGADRGYGLATKENATEDYRPRLELTAVLGMRTTAAIPNPPDGAQDVPRDVILNWAPGESADRHDVYVGASFDDVKSATPTNDPTGVYLGRSVQTLYPQTGALRLDFDQTYYWRIDEVDAPPDNTVHEGTVWSFTTEPLAIPIPGASITATASSATANRGPENTLNGSGLVNDLHSAETADMWLSSIDGPQPTWIQYEFDKAYKLHEMWVWNSNSDVEIYVGFGVRDVSIEYSVDGVVYTPLGTAHEFAQAPGAPGYAHNTTVDLSGITAKYVRLTANSNWGVLVQYGLSEVRFFSIPVFAREPSPDSGATDVDVDVTLGWRAGREAARHDVYVGEDASALVSAGSATQPAFGTASLGLVLGQSYYWRIDEVNDAEATSIWQGDIWSFSTREFHVVDDFESYNDIPTGQEGSNLVYETWADGFASPTTNGSTIGYTEAFQPTMESQIVQGGNQSVPLGYDDSVASRSEVSVNTADLAIGPDWAKGGTQTLVLWFYGRPGNATTERMYVKINGSKVLYGGDPVDLARPQWTQWSIDLAALGVNLGNVATLSIGFERTGATGGSGTILIDDIRLYRQAPPVPAEVVWVEAETGTVTAPTRLFDDPNASGGRYVSTEPGTADAGSAPPYPSGTVSIPFTVQGGTYTLRFRIGFPGGDDSCWVRIPDATTQSPVHSSGWVHFNDIPTGDFWHWSQEVKSEDEPGEPPVQFTLAAGTHTLEISYRGADLRIDAIVISKID